MYTYREGDGGKKILKLETVQNGKQYRVNSSYKRTPL